MQASNRVPADHLAYASRGPSLGADRHDPSEVVWDSSEGARDPSSQYHPAGQTPAPTPMPASLRLPPVVSTPSAPSAAAAAAATSTKPTRLGSRSGSRPGSLPGSLPASRTASRPGSGNTPLGSTSAATAVIDATASECAAASAASVAALRTTAAKTPAASALGTPGGSAADHTLLLKLATFATPVAIQQMEAAPQYTDPALPPPSFVPAQARLSILSCATLPRSAPLQPSPPSNPI